MSNWQTARNILALRLDNAGDVVMVGPALRAVKHASPEARITLLASPAGTAAAALLPWVDKTITWRAIWQDLGHLPWDPSREAQLIDQLNQEQFDAALVFTSFSQTPHSAAYACLQAGIPLRAGHSKEFGGAVLTDWLRGLSDDLHQVERNLQLVEYLGFPVQDRSLEVRISEAAYSEAARALTDVGVDPRLPFVLLHPGASAAARRYPADRWGAAAALLREDGIQVIVTGVEREREIVEQVAAIGAVPGLVNATSLQGYAALIQSAALVLCGNTLPLHLADAVGTPVLACFSGTDLESQWRPRAVPSVLLRKPTPCAPCHLFSCPIGLPCLDITPGEVAATALGMLRHAGQPEEVPGISTTRLRSATPPSAPTSVAVFQSLGLGDLLCTTPALNALHAHWPNAQFTLVGQPWATTLIGRIPAIDRVIPFPGWQGLTEGPDSLDPMGISALRSEDFDVVLQLHGSGPQSNAFLTAIDAGFTAGFSLTGSDGDGLDVTLPWDPDRPEPLRWLDLVEALGATTRSSQLVFTPTPQDMDFAASILELTGPRAHVPTIGLHPGASDHARRWPVHKFARLSEELHEQTGARLVVTGSSGERDLIDDLIRQCAAPLLDISGKTTIGQLAGAISMLDLLITNDTGASHVAVAVGTPSVVLFGPAPVRRWAPLNQERHRLMNASALRQDLPPELALAALPVSSVLSTALSVLAERPRALSLSSTAREEHPEC